MSLFSRKQPAGEPVRRDQVRRLLLLGMKETEAADRDIDSPEFREAKAARDAAVGESTTAELDAAHEALKRHGY